MSENIQVRAKSKLATEVLCYKDLGTTYAGAEHAVVEKNVPVSFIVHRRKEMESKQAQKSRRNSKVKSELY